MEKEKKITEKDILLDNLRICRMILNFTPDDDLINQCRLALKENIMVQKGRCEKTQSSFFTSPFCSYLFNGTAKVYASKNLRFLTDVYKRQVLPLIKSRKSCLSAATVCFTA